MYIPTLQHLISNLFKTFSVCSWHYFYYLPCILAKLLTIELPVVLCKRYFQYSTIVQVDICDKRVIIHCIMYILELILLHRHVIRVLYIHWVNWGVQQNFCPYSVPLQFFSLLGRSFKFIALQNCSKFFLFIFSLYLWIVAILLYLFYCSTHTNTHKLIL